MGLNSKSKSIFVRFYSIGSLLLFICWHNCEVCLKANVEKYQPFAHKTILNQRQGGRLLS